MASTTASSSATVETLRRTASFTSPVYQSFVSAIPGLTNAPAEAESHPHHVTSSNGTISKFKNPYPSYVDNLGPVFALKNILWYVRTSS